MAVIQWSRCQAVAENEFARRWLQIQLDLGLAQNTVDAYARGLDEFLRFASSSGVPAIQASRETIAAYLGHLRSKATDKGKIICISAPGGLSNATLQQRLTAYRLFFDFLIEERQCERNPVGRGRFTLRNGFGNACQRGLIPRVKKLPRIPDDVEWLHLVGTVKRYSVRTRLMFALSYDMALRRQELCSLATSDVDPARQLIRVRAETTKNQLERVIPYSSQTGVLYQQYLEARRVLGQKRGPLFLSESPRNRTEPISIWSWSKIVRELARESGLTRLGTHTLRHLRLTDLARADWDIHEIAMFAGHRSLRSTLDYIHLSGRELAKKLERTMADWTRLRLQQITEVKP